LPVGLFGLVLEVCSVRSVDEVGGVIGVRGVEPFVVALHRDIISGVSTDGV